EVLMLLAISIANAGDDSTAAIIAEAIAANSKLIHDPDMFFRIAGMFIKSHQITRGLSLAAKLIRNEATEPASRIMFMGLLPFASEEHDEEEVIRFLKEACQ